MSEPLEVHVCELCGQRQFDRCPECDGEGETDYASGCSYSDGAERYFRYQCERCTGSGWASIPCGCAVAPKLPLPTVDQILAKFRSEKEKSA